MDIVDKKNILKPYKELHYECNLALDHEYLAKKETDLHYKYKELEETLNNRTKEVFDLGSELASLRKENRDLKNKLNNEPIKSNILTVNVKATEIDEVKNIIASFIFMLEDSRIDKDIRLQYLESCKELKEQYFVRIDK